MDKHTVDAFIAREKVAVVLVNLGTPDAPTPKAVRRYLKEFLSDPRVVEAPRLIWWWVLRCFILPFRPGRVAKLYQQIWEQDSPIRTLTATLTEQLQQRLGKETQVQCHYAMTYGNPSLVDCLDKLQENNVDRVLILPLYPQYSASTTASVSDLVTKWSLKKREIPEIRLIKDYWQSDRYLEAIAASVTAHQQTHGEPDKLLFSFHGIPQEYEDKGDRYGVRCRETARLVATRLGLGADQWAITFQSRFGPKAWLQPYTDETLAQWAKQNVKHVQVVCPGFAIDCLETLEEIDGENREVFLHGGGAEFSYIPALNASDAHVDVCEQLVRENLQGWRVDGV